MTEDWGERERWPTPPTWRRAPPSSLSRYQDRENGEDREIEEGGRGGYKDGPTQRALVEKCTFV